MYNMYMHMYMSRDTSNFLVAGVQIVETRTIYQDCNHEREHRKRIPWQNSEIINLLLYSPTVCNDDCPMVW
jgi:hypothetical protein